MEEVKCSLALLNLVEAGVIRSNRLRNLLLEIGDVVETVNVLRRGEISVDVDRFEGEAERLSKLGIEVIPISSLKYPSRLRGVRNAPPVIFKRGRAELKGEFVAIVGTRNPTPHGLNIARQFARTFVRMGFGIVSGLALGIDTEAHRGALDAGGRTIAVLGCDLRRVYPERNRGLAQVILGRGALISEHRRAEPTPRNLVLRNRLISGLSAILLALEPEKGALRAVRYAISQSRSAFIGTDGLGARGFIRREDGVYLFDYTDIPSIERIARRMISIDDRLHP
ncbi:TPA: DNA-processing protein DprA, partial [Candidatus Poribacteria bacterium]|nr:DNA-processing protein DprA [Candidatus Poribacteria bacterium]HEX29907.1 DNA-processing protein DprA [Candidatus Poribacteria bacterium]